MAYYPSAAFFEERPNLSRIAYSLLINLEEEIKIVGLETISDFQKEVSSTMSKMEAISFLDDHQDISGFWIEDDLNAVRFDLYDNLKHVDINFWDFENELYVNNSITQSMQNQKREFAISMNATLLKHCGAKLSLINSLDHKRYESEFDDDFDVIHFISKQLKQKQFEGIFDIPQTTSWIWLLGVQKNILPTGVLNEKVMQGFREVKNDETILIIESMINQPPFMDDIDFLSVYRDKKI